MQGILSSMMLRDYYQYTPEEVQAFRSMNYRQYRADPLQPQSDPQEKAVL